MRPINTHEVIANINNALKEIKTYGFLTETEMKVNRSGLRMKGEGVADEEERKLRLEMEISIAGERVKTRTYIIGEKLYTKVESRNISSTWIKSPARVGWEEYSELKKSAKLLREEKIKSIKLGKEGGEECYIIEIIPPSYEEIIKELPPRAKGLVKPGDIKQIKMIYFFRREDYLPLKFEMEMKIETGDIPLLFFMRTTFRDINKDVDIELPEEAEGAIEYTPPSLIK